MTMKINTALDHIEKSLVANRAAGFSLPSHVLDTIQPTIDAKGWQRLVDYESSVTTTAGPTSNVFGPTVPEDEMHYILAAELQHTDSGAALNIGIKIDLLPGEVFLTSTVNTAAGFRVALLRPVVVLPGGRLTGNSLTPGVGVTFNFILQYYFIRLKLGEYITASPYG